MRVRLPTTMYANLLMDLPPLLPPEPGRQVTLLPPVQSAPPHLLPGATDLPVSRATFRARRRRAA
jgi:hypothetical protein